jgi:hypothetical protein
MSENDDPTKEVFEEWREWRQRFETGKVTIYVDEPLEVGATPAGEVVLKFACGQLGNFERAAMAVAVLSPAVARRLKAIFPNIESIADTPLPTHDE